MAFESLSEKLQNVFKNLRGKGKLSEADVKAALKEVKMALLEADVNFKVVKNFVSSVQERAVGEEVLESSADTSLICPTSCLIRPNFSAKQSAFSYPRSAFVQRLIISCTPCLLIPTLVETVKAVT